MDSATRRDSAYQASSKVKVEYADPSSVFAQIAPELHARLPLRNLNWNSQSRPLRSIDSLFVELVPDRTSSLSRPTSSAGPDAQPGRRSESPVQRERRHQIPGLRSTPYLKVYLLRCDDSDTYKTSGRKVVREWIKANNLSPAKNSRVGQENHDAAEWLIIHVAPVEGGGWPTKAHTSVVDKLRSDFNSSSKSAPDRVAQIPFSGDFQVQGATADAVPAGPAREQFVQESNRAWEALLAKMKTLILLSFDSRVRQYEEDIKEKSSQRHLPGWNFCTFFMLKEGLSIGFESVGLLDDALMGYDELSVELLNTMRETESGGGANMFRDHTADLLKQAEAAQKGSESSKRSHTTKLSSSFIETDEKPYRELIMANNISLFDFRCYVFVRQVAVLMRSARLSGEDAYDPTVLADICRRAVTFITSNSRTVRRDLQTSFKAGDDEESLAKRHTIIENIVSTWTFSSAQQILKHTEDVSLSQDMDRQPLEKKRFNSPSKGKSPEVAKPQTHSASLSSDNQDAAQSQANSQKKAALLSLASQRAKLCALSRASLKAIGERAAWKYGTSSSLASEEFEDIDMEGGSGATTPKPPIANKKYFVDSLPNDALRAAVESQPAYFAALEDLSWKEHDLYQYAEDENLVHAVVADIAVLRYHLKDYSSAASYLHMLAPFYAEHEWNDLEVAMLDMYSSCLKHLDRNEDYVRIALKLLARTARHVLDQRLKKSPLSALAKPARVTLKNVVEASQSLPEPFVAPFQNQFFNVETSGTIQHVDSDGFRLDLRFQHALSESFEVENAELRLIGLDAARGREIKLTSAGPITIEPGIASIPLRSLVMIPGKFVVSGISMRTGNVSFEHQVPPEGPLELSVSRPSELDQALRSQPILLWPSSDSLTVTGSLHPHIHLEKARYIQLAITTGKASVSSVRLQLKAGSAGLRLRTAEAKAADGKAKPDAQPGIIQLSDLQAGESITVSVPYQLDNDLREITVRSEVSYTSDQGELVFGNNHTISVNLPLGVNVQDIFQRSALFSKFSVTTSSTVPLRVLRCELDGTEDFQASTALQDTSGLAVFLKQPVNMVYKTVRTAPDSKHKLDTRLLMHVWYRCLDEEVQTAVLACLATALEGELAKYLPLLSNHLHIMLKQHLQRVDLTGIGLLREFSLPPFDSLSWMTVLAAIASSERSAVRDWLEAWHRDHKMISIDDSDEDAAATERKITIPVDVPPMPVVSTASLALRHPAGSALHVGDVVPATLTISHTRAWAQSPTNENEPFTFVYEIDVSSEAWLLSGARRKVFTARENEVSTFQLALIPQRAGHLLLPGIEVRVEQPRGEPDAELQCETHNRTMAEAVLVVPGAGQVSVGMAFETPTGGPERVRQVSNAWVIEAEGWEAVQV